MCIRDSYFALTSGGYGQHWQEVPVRYSGFGWAQTNGNTNDMCGWLQCDYTDDLLTNAWYVICLLYTSSLFYHSYFVRM